MTNDKRNKDMADRRESFESRLDLLEYRMHVFETEQTKTIELLNSINDNQKKTQTLIGAASYLVVGGSYGIWYLSKDMLKHWFEKIFI
jgi:hypothetical protein